MLIFSTQDPEAPELHTDPALQSQRWNKLYRSARRGFVWDAALLVLVAVLTALLLSMPFLPGTPTPPRFL